MAREHTEAGVLWTLFAPDARTRGLRARLRALAEVAVARGDECSATGGDRALRATTVAGNRWRKSCMTHAARHAAAGLTRLDAICPRPVIAKGVTQENDDAIDTMGSLSRDGRLLRAAEPCA